MYSKLEFKETVQILDSMCTLAVLQNETAPLREWMANRTGEILSIMRVNDIYHVRSKLNISDLATRTDATVEDTSPGSDWQDGPAWMRLPRSEWPLTQDTRGMAVPEEETQNIAIVGATTEMKTLNIDISRFKGRSYLLLLRTFARD